MCTSELCPSRRRTVQYGSSRSRRYASWCHNLGGQCGGDACTIQRLGPKVITCFSQDVAIGDASSIDFGSEFQNCSACVSLCINGAFALALVSITGATPPVISPFLEMRFMLRFLILLLGIFAFFFFNSRYCHNSLELCSCKFSPFAMIT